MTQLNEKINILVAEDDPSSRLLIEKILSKSGYHVTVAENGKVAYEIFSQRKTFHIIVTDINMPVMNGFESCQLIREYEAKNNFQQETPIIALTAYANDENLYKCKKAGCSGFLNKPINKDKLLAAIKKALVIQET